MAVDFLISLFLIITQSSKKAHLWNYIIFYSFFQSFSTTANLYYNPASNESDTVYKNRPTGPCQLLGTMSISSRSLFISHTIPHTEILLSLSYWKEKKKDDNNILYSHTVSHYGTNKTQSCLTSGIWRSPVLSWWYGRCLLLHAPMLISTTYYSIQADAAWKKIGNIFMKFSNIFFFFFHRLSFVFHPAPIPIPADYIFPNSADVTLQIKLEKRIYFFPIHSTTPSSDIYYFPPALDTTSCRVTHSIFFSPSRHHFSHHTFIPKSALFMSYRLSFIFHPNSISIQVRYIFFF